MSEIEEVKSMSHNINDKGDYVPSESEDSDNDEEFIAEENRKRNH